MMYWKRIRAIYNVVPVQVHSTEDFSVPVNCTFVVFVKVVNKMLDIVLVNEFGAEMV